MANIPDEEATDADLLLDRFDGPGNCVAIKVESPSDAPESFEIPISNSDSTTDTNIDEQTDESDVPTIEFDGTNWMNPDRSPANDGPPEDPVKPLEEMTEAEIRVEFKD